MTIILDGTAGIQNNATDLSYTGTLTGGTGVVNLGSGQVYKDASGNVGIGVTPSAWSSGRKAIELGSVGNAWHAGSGGNTQVDLVAGAYYNTGWKYAATNTGAISRFSMNDLQYGQVEWYNAAQGTAGAAITWTQAMTLDSSGNLLVGTTSNFNNGKISVVTASAILTGTISAGSGAGIGIDFQRTAANGDIAYFRSTTGLAGFITITGANTCTYNSVSDVRLKENIVDAPSALTRVESLQVRSFDWKDGTGAVPYGFIAQELNEVVPEAVSQGTTNEDGSMLTPWGVDTSLLVPYLTKAIQEQQTLITALTARITALEAANV